MAEDFKVQISVRDGAGNLYNFRGDSPAEVAEQLAQARELGVFAAAVAVLDIEIAKAAQSALGPTSVTANVAPAAVAAPAPAPSGSRSVRFKNPGAPRTDKQGALIVKLGGKDDPSLTVQQAAEYIDNLLAAKKG